MNDELGPLRALVGTWEGDRGIDTSFSHGRGEVISTPYRERVAFTPIGTVVSGRQRLVGLDYRAEMWPDDEVDPFHVEVGYWLWDAEGGEVLRAFVVPRGVTVLAGGPARADSTELSLSARRDDSRYTIGENRYLAEQASTLEYQVTVTTHGDGSWSYDATTLLQMAELSEPLAHTDRNTLHRVENP